MKVSTQFQHIYFAEMDNAIFFLFLVTREVLRLGGYISNFTVGTDKIRYSDNYNFIRADNVAPQIYVQFGFLLLLLPQERTKFKKFAILYEQFIYETNSY